MSNACLRLDINNNKSCSVHKPRREPAVPVLPPGLVVYNYSGYRNLLLLLTLCSAPIDCALAPYNYALGPQTQQGSQTFARCQTGISLWMYRLIPAGLIKNAFFKYIETDSLHWLCIEVTIKNPLEIWYFYKIRCGIASRLLFCCAHLNSVWIERSSRANLALLQPVCAHQEDCSRLHTGETERPRKKDDDLTAFQGWGCFLLHRCEIVWSGEDASFFLHSTVCSGACKFASLGSATWMKSLWLLLLALTWRVNQHNLKLKKSRFILFKV